MFHTINKRVRSWQQAGLISDKQGLDIIFFETNQKRFSQVMFQLAILLVFMGMVAVFGSNWIGISPLYKLTSLFGASLFLAYAANRAYQNVAIKLFEVSMFLLYVCCLSFLLSLGFWFQLTIEPHHIILFWSLATFPSTFLVRWQFTLFLWSVITTIGFYGLVTLQVAHDHELLLNILLSFPFILGLFASVGPKHLRKYFSWEAVLAFTMIVLGFSFSSALQLDAKNWLTFPSVASLLYIIVLKRYKKIDTEETASWVALLTLYNSLMLVNYNYMHSHGIIINFIVVLMSILCLCMAAFMAHNKGATLISRILLLICVTRAMVWYFESLGGVLFTGIGLIISGLTLYFVTWFTRKTYTWINPNYCHTA